MVDIHDRVAALIVAAGRGTRAAGLGAAPKQYHGLGSETVLARTIRSFLSNDHIALVQVVIHPDDITLYEAATAGLGSRLAPPVLGGATRQQSVHAGLRELAQQRIDHVLIHDAVRAFADPACIERVRLAVMEGTPAIAALPVTDTLKQSADACWIDAGVERSGLWRAQTPQGFPLPVALAMHAAADRAGRFDFTDDAAIAEWCGIRVRLVSGSELNFKITSAEDLMRASDMARLEADVRTGQGFDVHRFTAGDHVWLCGIRIGHSHGLEGHSDADVGLHALTDALLGAIGDGDIGEHFPPNNPQWRGAASHLFLADAASRVAGRGGRIINVDLTLLCEAPKISPHRTAMRQRIAEILGIAIDRIGVKATSTEGLGFTGRREGIAAMAVASIALPSASAPRLKL